VSAQVELQPDTEEILQAEPEREGPYIPPLCIEKVLAPVRVQLLPRKSGSTRTITLTTTPRRILTADHRRAWVKLRALDMGAAVAYAFNEASAGELSTMSELPGLEVEDLDVTAELWVRAVTGTARVGVTTGNWADGE
jgi:hypothetical protein